VGNCSFKASNFFWSSGVKFSGFVTHNHRLPLRCSLQLEQLEIRFVPSINTVASFNSTTGETPLAGLVMDSSGNLFGTASSAGANGDGTVFELARGSTTITALASFNGTNGANPEAALVMDSSGDLFGTTNNGGANSDGTVIEVAHGSNSITTLASFNGTNGEHPHTGLVMDGNGNLYGTTYGGRIVASTVFKLPAGSNTITTLASFGQQPSAGVILNGNLYGTTSVGGGSDGTVFELALGTSTLTTLATFDGTDGEDPAANLVVDGHGTLYGTTAGEGATGEPLVTAPCSNWRRGVRPSPRWCLSTRPMASTLIRPGS
jgi:uncharacterized repeat protein (TIGR03803 family)